MCANYTPTRPEEMLRLIGSVPEQAYPELSYPAATYPGYLAPIIRAESAALRASLAVFGLIPAWAKDRKSTRHTYNARTETVAALPSYRSAWRAEQFCLVPMERFYEPCWDTGKAVRWSIHRRDAAPFAVAAIWDSWADHASGEQVESFSMLTINADAHPVMGRFHRPGDERRSLVVVPPSSWAAWLGATQATAKELLREMPAAEFTAEPSELPRSSKAGDAPSLPTNQAQLF